MGLSASADKEVTVTWVTTADSANIDLAAAVADAITPDTSRDIAAAAVAGNISAAAAMMEAL